MAKATVYIRKAYEQLWDKLSDKSDWINKHLDREAQRQLDMIPDHYVFDEAQQKWVEPNE